MKKILLYYNTLKFLKFKQFWFRCVRSFFPSRIFPPHQEKPHLRNLQGKWKQVISHSSSLIKEDPLTVVLLNQEGCIETKESWNNPTKDKLWLYNLHYHFFLLSEVRPSLKDKILKMWMTQNPWFTGVGWEPYPLSLRIVNWIKYFMIQGKVNEDFQQSLYLQCCALERKIEYHLLGNHLFENAKALLFAALYFDTKRSNKWLKKSVLLLKEQLKEQILKDGGHFERSPMYHAIILEDILDVYQLLTISKQNQVYTRDGSLKEVVDMIHEIVPDMLGWLSSLSHPDGKISFFNDSTFGVAAESQAIYEYASFLGFSKLQPKQSFFYLKESGFGRVENKEAIILADIGSVGPSYIPGHAHAETLSFEASVKGERLFVNSGISTYAATTERKQQRSTLAHNSIQIDGENSSQVWSSFRVGKRAKTFGFLSREEDSSFSFSASHDGYQHLKYGLVHQREWSLFKKKILIKDTLQGKGTPRIIASFHLHPNWLIASHKKNVMKIKSFDSQRFVKVILPQDFDVIIEPYEYAIGFNLKEKGICLRVSSSSINLPYTFETVVEWAP